MRLCVEPSLCLQGDVVVPGDKSISHRAIILASLSEGQSEIINFLPSLDCLATLNILKRLGVKIVQCSPSHLLINGVGLKGLQDPGLTPLDCGNSGTTFRLLAGVLAAQPFASILTGDAMLRARPMQRIVVPLRKMGAILSDYPPMCIQPAPVLSAIDYTMPMASAQVKSCLLLAGLCANLAVTVREPEVSRDHTERMMRAMGALILKNADHSIRLEPVDYLKAIQLKIPGDLSSAAFLMVGAAMTPGSDLWIRNVGVNPTRVGIINLLQHMGADIQINYLKADIEPVADLHIKGNHLRGIEVPQNLVVSALDEFPIFFIAAATAKGRTLLKGATELRVKESDRINKMAVGLKLLGIELNELPDGMMIEGGQLQGGEVDSGGDHRIAMAFAMAGLGAEAPIFIKNCENILTSFPDFIKTVQSVGLKILREKNEY